MRSSSDFVRVSVFERAQVVTQIKDGSVSRNCSGVATDSAGRMIMLLGFCSKAIIPPEKNQLDSVAKLNFRPDRVRPRAFRIPQSNIGCSFAALVFAGRRQDESARLSSQILRPAPRRARQAETAWTQRRLWRARLMRCLTPVRSFVGSLRSAKWLDAKGGRMPNLLFSLRGRVPDDIV